MSCTFCNSGMYVHLMAMQQDYHDNSRCPRNPNTGYFQNVLCHGHPTSSSFNHMANLWTCNLCRSVPNDRFHVPCQRIRVEIPQIHQQDCQHFSDRFEPPPSQRELAMLGIPMVSVIDHSYCPYHMRPMPNEFVNGQLKCQRYYEH